MAKDQFIEGLEHFAPLLQSGLQTQKWINYSDAWFNYFLQTGQVQHPVWEHYEEKIAHRDDVLERIEILKLVDLVLRRGWAAPEDKEQLITYIEEKALVPWVFHKASGLSIHQTNMLLDKANIEALTKLKKAL